MGTYHEDEFGQEIERLLNFYGVAIDLPALREFVGTHWLKMELDQDAAYWAEEFRQRMLRKP